MPILETDIQCCGENDIQWSQTKGQIFIHAQTKPEKLTTM